MQPRPQPRRRPRRTVLRDAVIWNDPALFAQIEQVETDGGRLWVRLRFDRGPTTPSDDWLQAVREAVGIVEGDGADVQVACIAGGRHRRCVGRSSGGGENGLSVDFKFEPATVPCRVVVGWPRMGLPETAVEL